MASLANAVALRCKELSTDPFNGLCRSRSGAERLRVREESAPALATSVAALRQGLSQ
jgi:hypothetical protein